MKCLNAYRLLIIPMLFATAQPAVAGWLYTGYKKIVQHDGPVKKFTNEQCPSCREHFDDEKRKQEFEELQSLMPAFANNMVFTEKKCPVFLEPCGHQFCTDCCKTHFFADHTIEDSRDGGEFIIHHTVAKTCPECRQAVDLDQLKQDIRKAEQPEAGPGAFERFIQNTDHVVSNEKYMGAVAGLSALVALVYAQSNSLHAPIYSMNPTATMLQEAIDTVLGAQFDPCNRAEATEQLSNLLQEIRAIGGLKQSTKKSLHSATIAFEQALYAVYKTLLGETIYLKKSTNYKTAKTLALGVAYLPKGTYNSKYTAYTARPQHGTTYYDVLRINGTGAQQARKKLQTEPAVRALQSCKEYLERTVKQAQKELAQKIEQNNPIVSDLSAVTGGLRNLLQAMGPASWLAPLGILGTCIVCS